MQPWGDVVPVKEMTDKDIEVQEIEPAHASHPRSFVLSPSGERYANTRSQRRKARKVSRQARKRNR